MTTGVPKPSRADLDGSAGKTVPDVIAPGLAVLFCGINPGLYSAYTGYHFARPGNRFWPTLYAAGFTPRLLRPDEQRELLPLGYGVTNLVTRATASAAELREEEMMEGAKVLTVKVAQYRPSVVAVLGISAYRHAFRQPHAVLGEQPLRLSGARVLGAAQPERPECSLHPGRAHQRV